MQEPTQTERALLRVARTLAAAIDVEGITAEITATALELTGATGVYVERIISSDGTVDVIANAGTGTPPYGTRVPYPGSLTEEIIESGEPLLMDTLVSIGENMAPYLKDTCDGCLGLIVPLQSEGDVVGSLVLLRTKGISFTEHDANTARILGDLASVALKRVVREAELRDRQQRFQELAENAHAEADDRRLDLERMIANKSRLIRGFSHDIKNPLGAADGYAQLLLDGLMGELTPKQEESMGRIRAGIATALGLINDVVEFSRAETGQIEVRPSPFIADALVREVVEEHRAEASRAGATIQTGELGGGRIICDAIRIRQILGNLLSNAIKYGGTDGPITVDARRENGEPSRILFSVSDSGPGIPLEKQHLLFEEFQRLHTGKKEGSGLGLAISRRIARVLGGDIIVDSDAGRGSTFTLWIPAPPPE